MSNKFLPWLLLFFALGLSTTAAWYSVIGLSIVFSGVALPVMIMGGFLEGSKLVIATYLHNQWKNSYAGLKIYLTSALVVLSVITSIGIYGLLSKGFQENITKLEISNKQVGNVEIKKKRFEQTKKEYISEKQTLEKDISSLRESIATGTKTQYKDRETGQIITTNSSSARRAFEKQLTQAISNRDTVSLKIESLNDSITNLEIKVLNMETQNEEANELGVIQSVSEMTGWSLQKVANLFILILIIVFDPLAISLVLATNQAFKNSKPKMSMYGEPKIEDKKDWSQEIPTQDVEQKIVETLEKELSTPPPPPTPKPSNQEQIKKLEAERDKISKSNVSSKRRGLALQNIQSQINKLKDNQIEY